MDRLPLERVAEIAFLTGKVRECMDFYRRIGLDLPAMEERINFAAVGEQLFGFCNERDGFFDGKGGFVKARLHVAFEVPEESLDECISFLRMRGVETSPKSKFENFHGTRSSTSVYFFDPAGNIIELWAPHR